MENPYNNDINYSKNVNQYHGRNVGKSPQLPGSGRGRQDQKALNLSEFDELGKCGCGCQWDLTGTDYQMNQGFYDRTHKTRNKKNILRKTQGIRLLSVPKMLDTE